MKKVGVLSLQGAFHKHKLALERLGCLVHYVRRPEDLKDCKGLIIPGGESTTLIRHIHEEGLYTPILQFAEQYPIFGTCAGAILLSEETADHSISPLGIIPITTERNSYGSQVDSFIEPLTLSFSKEGPCKAAFIRAPKISKWPSSATILANYQNSPVLLSYQNHLVATFHPELSNDLRVHKYFLDRVPSYSK